MKKYTTAYYIFPFWIFYIYIYWYPYRFPLGISHWEGVPNYTINNFPSSEKHLRRAWDVHFMKGVRLSTCARSKKSYPFMCLNHGFNMLKQWKNTWNILKTTAVDVSLDFVFSASLQMDWTPAFAVLSGLRKPLADQLATLRCLTY